MRKNRKQQNKNLKNKIIENKNIIFGYVIGWICIKIGEKYE